MKNRCVQPLLWRGITTVLLSLAVSNLYAKMPDEREVKALSFIQMMDKVKAYQASQGIWQTQQAIADANLHNSQLWQNPSLEIQRAGFDRDQDQEWSVAVSQPLDIFGQTKAMHAVAQLSQQQVTLKQKIYDQQLEILLQSTWSQALLAEIETRLLQEQLKVSQENLAVAEKRFQAGSIALVDVDRVKLSQTNTLSLVQQADLQRQMGRSQLANLWGEATTSAAIGHDLQAMWPVDTEEKVHLNLTENLIEKALKLDVANTHANLDLLQAKARPNPDLLLQMKRTKTSQNQIENQLTVGVSIPLMLFNRQQYAMQIAQHKAQLLTQQQQFYQQQNQLAVQTLLVELNGLKTQFDVMLQQQIPLAIRVQQKTRDGFAAGKLNVMDVQQATSQLLDLRLQSVQLLKAAWQKSIEVQSLSLGIEPSQAMSSQAVLQINQSLIQETQALPVIGMEN